MTYENPFSGSGASSKRPMHRRRLLAKSGVGFAASLGGCLGAGPAGESTSYRIDRMVTEPPPDLPIVPGVSAASAAPTADRPMRVAVEWENERREPVRFGEERSAVFHAARSDDERAHLLADEYGTWDDVVSRDGCWYVSGEVGGDGAYRVGELGPGERRAVELGFYAASDDCLATGSYRFRNRIWAWRSADDPAHPPSQEWGFVVHVAEGED